MICWLIVILVILFLIISFRVGSWCVAPGKVNIELYGGFFHPRVPSQTALTVSDRPRFGSSLPLISPGEFLIAMITIPTLREGFWFVKKELRSFPLS